jgi:hypothetical protein
MGSLGLFLALSRSDAQSTQVKRLLSVGNPSAFVKQKKLWQQSNYTTDLYSTLDRSS